MITQSFPFINIMNWPRLAHIINERVFQLQVCFMRVYCSQSWCWFLIIIHKDNNNIRVYLPHYPLRHLPRHPVTQLSQQQSLLFLYPADGEKWRNSFCLVQSYIYIVGVGIRKSGFALVPLRLWLEIVNWNKNPAASACWLVDCTRGEQRVTVWIARSTCHTWHHHSVG